MSVVDDLVGVVRESEKLDEGKKGVVVAFLRAAGPTLESLGETGFAAVMGAAGSGGSVTDAVARNLDVGQVALLVEATEKQMADLAAAHGVEVAAARAAVAQLQTAALMAVARALIGAI